MSKSETQEKPDYVEDIHLKYLDKVREAGLMNMFNSPMVLQKEFGLNLSEAKGVFGYWVKTFDSRRK